jgi:hypothetical protein
LKILLTSVGLFCYAHMPAQPLATPYQGFLALSNYQADVFTARSNPAAHAGLRQTTIAAYGERRFMLQDLNLVQLSGALPTRSGNFGLHAGYFGGAGYHQSQLALAYGRQVGKGLDLGLAFHYHQLTQGAFYGNARAFTGSLGMRIHLPANMHLGISAYNPFRAAWNQDKSATLPGRYAVGLGMDLSEKMFAGIETIKEENLPVDVQAGFHYSLLPQFFLRAGIATQTGTWLMAFGFRLPGLRFDITSSYHPQLGWSPGILLLAQWGGEEESPQTTLKN